MQTLHSTARFPEQHTSIIVYGALPYEYIMYIQGKMYPTVPSSNHHQKQFTTIYHYTRLSLKRWRPPSDEA